MSAAYFGDGTQFGLEIDHFVESEPLGKVTDRIMAGHSAVHRGD